MAWSRVLRYLLSINLLICHFIGVAESDYVVYSITPIRSFFFLSASYPFLSLHFSALYIMHYRFVPLPIRLIVDNSVSFAL